MIVLGCDHTAVSMKNDIMKYLESVNLEYSDLGTYSNHSVDYSDYAEKVISNIIDNTADKGILICGTGVGMSIAANRHSKIRAGLCTDTFMAEATRSHNDANVLVLGSRVLGVKDALSITKVFLETPFSKEERHIRRINKLG